MIMPVSEISSKEIREKFLKFFEKKGHKIVPSSSLIPTDPSVLLTTAGVQQFKPYYTGRLDPIKDFGGRRVISIQKSFRTTDIEEVGDKTHGTFFEMLGYFSFGDYFKKETIIWCQEFLNQSLNINPKRILFTVFSGNDQVPRDEESLRVLTEDLGIKEGDIKFGGVDDNFWGPTGNQGPCGPSVEVYVDGVEIGTLVFNEYFSSGGREQLLAGQVKLVKLDQSGVDVGLGLERLTALAGGSDDVYTTDLLNPLMAKIKNALPDIPDPFVRILTDHLRAVVFLTADGVRPLNKGAGYILRRLLRRIMAHGGEHLFSLAVDWVNEKYGQYYPELNRRKELIVVLEEEREKFQKAVKAGLKKINEYSAIGAKEAFYLYESFGLPLEVIRELGGTKTANLRQEDFDNEFKKHQEISRAGMEKKFGGHGLLLDTGELKAGNEEELKKVTRLHTATHLLQQALRDVLGQEVQQRGSDITVERTRFDFSFPRKVTAEEIKGVEEIVNQKIKEDLPVNFVELSKDEAVKTGALFFFKEKYPEKVRVYYVGRDVASAYSKEFCGGPHVAHTGAIGQFKVIKEEAVGADTRRLRATVDR